MALPAIDHLPLQPARLKTGILNIFSPVDLSDLPSEFEIFIIDTLSAHGFGYRKDGQFHMIEGYPELIPSIKDIVLRNSADPSLTRLLIIEEMANCVDKKESPIRRIYRQDHALYTDRANLAIHWYFRETSIAGKLKRLLIEKPKINEELLGYLPKVTMNPFKYLKIDKALWGFKQQLDSIHQFYFQSTTPETVPNLDGVLTTLIRNNLLPLISELSSKDEDIEGIAEVISAYLGVSRTTYQIIRAVLKPQEA